MDSKKLEALYNEYKKLKKVRGYDEGGDVKSDSDSEKYGQSLTKTASSNEPKAGDQPDAFKKFASNFADGGAVGPGGVAIDPDKARQLQQGFTGANDPGVLAKILQLAGVSNNNNMAYGGTVRGYANGIDDVPAPEIDEDLSKQELTQKDPEMEDSYKAQNPLEAQDEEPIIVRGGQDQAIDKAVAEEFGKDAEDSDKAPASDEDQPEDKLNETKHFAEQFEKDEEKQPDEEETDKEVKASDETEEPSKEEEKPEEPTEDEESQVEQLLKAKKGQTLDFGPGDQDTMSDLAKAQAERKQELLADQVLKYANLAGSGIAKAQPLPPGYFDSSKLAELPVKSIEEKISMEKYDPNSSVSKAMRQFIEQKYGMKINGNPSAADLESIAKPLYTEGVAYLRGVMAAKLAQQRGQSQKELAGVKGEEARKTEEVKQTGRKEIAGMKAAQKLDALGDEAQKEITRLKSSARSPYGRAQGTIMFADKIPALLNKYKNLNDVPDTIVTDANLAFTNLISQGVPPERLQRLLNKNNLPRQPAKIWEWLTADPTGANQKEMLQLITESAANQKALAEAQLKDAVIPIIRQKHLRGMGDKSLNALLSDNGGISKDEYANWKPGYFTNNYVRPPQGVSTGKKIVKKGYNKATNQTQLIYDDGSSEIKEGKL